MTSIDDPAALQVEDLAPHLDLFDPSHSERLWEVLSYARSACPVLKTDADEGYYIVTRYDDLRTVLEDAETYSSEQAGLRGVPSARRSNHSMDVPRIWRAARNSRSQGSTVPRSSPMTTEPAADAAAASAPSVP